jgi:hypothetical protein
MRRRAVMEFVYGVLFVFAAFSLRSLRLKALPLRTQRIREGRRDNSGKRNQRVAEDDVALEARSPVTIPTANPPKAPARMPMIASIATLSKMEPPRLISPPEDCGVDILARSAGFSDTKIAGCDHWRIVQNSLYLVE